MGKSSGPSRARHTGCRFESAAKQGIPILSSQTMAASAIRFAAHRLTYGLRAERQGEGGETLT